MAQETPACVDDRNAIDSGDPVAKFSFPQEQLLQPPGLAESAVSLSASAEMLQQRQLHRQRQKRQQQQQQQQQQQDQQQQEQKQHLHLHLQQRQERLQLPQLQQLRQQLHQSPQARPQPQLEQQQQLQQDQPLQQQEQRFKSNFVPPLTLHGSPAREVSDVPAAASDRDPAFGEPDKDAETADILGVDPDTSADRGSDVTSLAGSQLGASDSLGSLSSDARSKSEVSTSSRSSSASTASAKSQQRSELDKRRRPAWTPDEHAKFLQGLTIFGHGNWQAISKYVGTKSSTQAKSHSQKYFMKLQKIKERADQMQREQRSVFEATSRSGEFSTPGFSSTSPWSNPLGAALVASNGLAAHPSNFPGNPAAAAMLGYQSKGIQQPSSQMQQAPLQVMQAREETVQPTFHRTQLQQQAHPFPAQAYQHHPQSQQHPLSRPLAYASSHRYAPSPSLGALQHPSPPLGWDPSNMVHSDPLYCSSVSGALPRPSQLLVESEFEYLPEAEFQAWTKALGALPPTGYDGGPWYGKWQGALQVKCNSFDA